MGDLNSFAFKLCRKRSEWEINELCKGMANKYINACSLHETHLNINDFSIHPTLKFIFRYRCSQTQSQLTYFFIHALNAFFVMQHFRFVCFLFLFHFILFQSRKPVFISYIRNCIQLGLVWEEIHFTIRHLFGEKMQHVVVIYLNIT